MKKSLFHRFSLVIALLSLCFFVAAQNTYVVNTIDDQDDSTCNLTHCSLREAILAANANIGPDTILFDIPGTGPHTILLDTLLPHVEDNGTVIDATSQPGNFPMAEMIVLDGSMAGGGAGITSGVTFGSATADHEIYGLKIQNFQVRGLHSYAADAVIGKPDRGNVVISCVGGLLATGQNTIIQGNYIGTDLNFSQGLGNDGHGIFTSTGSGSNLRIGGDFDLGEGNIVVNNGYNGIGISGNGSVIEGNYIGAVPGSNDDFGNGGSCVDCGAIVSSADDIVIGGSGARSNIIANNKDGVILGDFFGFPNNNRITENRIFCNTLGGISIGSTIDTNAVDLTPSPVILSIKTEITGQAMPGDTIELFLADELCGAETPCQGKDFLGRTVADGAGDWSLPTPASLERGDRITATATPVPNSMLDGNNTSLFSSCFVFIPYNVHVVNTTDDQDDTACDLTHCSLREAILKANANIGPDTILFDIPGAGPHTIVLDTLLPRVMDNGTVIDATSQPDNFPMAGLVVLDGSLAGTYTAMTGILAGITFAPAATANHEIYGLQIQNFETYGIYSYTDNAVIGKPDKGNVIISCNGGMVISSGENVLIQGNYIGTDLNFSQGLGNVRHGIQLAGDQAASVTIGGDFNLGEGNIIVNNGGNGIGVRGPGSIITGNYIGAVPGTNDNFGNVGVNCTGCGAIYAVADSSMIGGSGGRTNIIANNRAGIVLGESDFFPSNNLITENRIFCNTLGGIILGAVDTGAIILTPPPVILSVTTQITGQAMPGDTIELFVADKLCETETPCQGKDFLGRTVADGAGVWSFPTPDSLERGDRITATATPVPDPTHGGNNTSLFSSCFVILPDECAFAEPLSLNTSPCASSGIILDLKQMSASLPAPGSVCDSTYQGADAWLKVGVPSTGNFLLRTNVNNTVTPVIEVYTDCGNMALPECQVLDSLPYIMVFENYTPADTLYLRVWDKDNATVDSENTALLHLTAHTLASDPSEWEICDFEDLISTNPTNLIRREAATFVLDYEVGTPESEIAQTTQELIAEGLELKRECLCGTQPTQLWSTVDAIELEAKKGRVAKTRGSVDTTNYNYIFEAIEFQVNSYAIGQQHDADVAMEDEGNFAMVWKDEQRRHNYGRVYKSSGNPVSVEFQIGSSAKTQYASSVDMFDNGDFIAVWHEIDETDPESESAVWGRLYFADGSPKTAAFNISFPAAATSLETITMNKALYGANARVSTNGNDEFVVAWHAGKRIYAQRLDQNGGLIDSIIYVGPTASIGELATPAVDMNDSGVFVVSWTDVDNSGNGVYVRRFDANGQALGQAFLASSRQGPDQTHPDIALHNDGSFIVVWEDRPPGATNNPYDIYRTRFNAQGNVIQSDYQVNSYISSAQRRPSIALFDDHKFVIAWSSLGQDGFAEGIYAKLFDVNGNPILPDFNTGGTGAVGPEFRMNAYAAPQQKKVRTAANGSTLFIGAWEDGANDGSFEGIFAQRYEVNTLMTPLSFYPIGTATPSVLLGDQLDYPTDFYTPDTSATMVKVAILDTGIDQTHPRFQNAIWNNPEENDEDNCLLGDEIGYDFVNQTGDPADLDGHGTQVNSIVLREFTDDLQLELMNLKFHELNRGSVFDAICGIYYAVDNGAQIINLSWGFEATEEPEILKKALQYASDRDVLIITTAGNTSKNNDLINKYPANLDIPNMIVVTAYEYRSGSEEIKLANYASYGNTKVDIAAYGYVEALRQGGGRTSAAGTSLAAPAVARTAAIIRGRYPSLTAAEIKNCILSSAQAEASLSDKVATGGILDHAAALQCAEEKANLLVRPVVYLQGAYEPDLNLMRDNLRESGLLPLNEPYADLGYAHLAGGGGESTTNAVLNAVFDTSDFNTVVDWVFLELRDIAGAPIATRSALLQRDGDVVDTDGVSPVSFSNVSAGDYYLVVKHRNHLGVMSAAPVALSGIETVVDFTNDLNQVFGGGNGSALLADGRLGLFSGDYNRNGQVQNTDFNLMIPNLGLSGYNAGDFDLNGQVQNTDLQLKLIPNIGRGQPFGQ